ncbi:MAG: SemiSWEET transporter [Candidatus Kapaibacterium sp.]
MEVFDIIGFAAAFCTTSAFVPQVVKIIQTKQARDISLVMYLIFTLGLILWLTYGIIIGSWPVIMANLVTLLLAGLVIFYKIKYDKSDYNNQA